MEAVVVSIIVGVGIVGALVGRWWTLLLPCAVVPFFYLGLHRDWWGYGLGDGWPAAMAVVLLLALIATSLGVAVRSVGR